MNKYVIRYTVTDNRLYWCSEIRTCETSHDIETLECEIYVKSEEAFKSKQPTFNVYGTTLPTEHFWKIDLFSKEPLNPEYSHPSIWDLDVWFDISKD